VKRESRMQCLLQCLQKTPPPVLIFCENKADVDDIYEYLLVKGVEAVSIHSSKDQEERERAMRSFRESKKDVLVATDIISKGLDFPDIKHVINFDMPKEIENYVHRIGRTGRRGKVGLATTFVSKSTPTSILLDLKQILVESNQRIPSFLQFEGESTSTAETKACAVCGGLGHRVNDCPKMQRNAAKATTGKEFTGGSDW